MDDTEVYDSGKEAFALLLELAGIPIIFNGVEHTCVPTRFEKKLEYPVSGFFEEATAAVDMMDDDFADFIGIDQQDAIVEVNGLMFKVITIDANPVTPIVRMTLTKSK